MISSALGVAASTPVFAPVSFRCCYFSRFVGLYVCRCIRLGSVELGVGNWRFARLCMRRCIRGCSLDFISRNLWMVGLYVCRFVVFGSKGLSNGHLRGCCSLRNLMSNHCRGSGKVLLEFLKFSQVQLVPEDLSLCLKPINCY